MFIMGLIDNIPPIAWEIIGASLIFHTLFASLYYSISKIIQSPTQLAKSKELFKELVFSAFIIFVFISMNGVITSIISSLACFGGSSCTNIDVIALANYSLEIIKISVVNLYTKLYLFEGIIATISSISFTMGVIKSGLITTSIYISPFSGLAMITNAQVTVVESVGYMLGVVFAKMSILEMIKYAIPMIFLPMGLTFRAFPQLRKTGSTILALCFTLYYLFPLSIILTNYVVYSMYQPSISYISLGDPDPVNSVCKGEGISEMGIQDIINAGDGLTISGSSNSMWDTVKDIFGIAGTVVKTAYTASVALLKVIFKGGINNIFGIALNLINPINGVIKPTYGYLILEMESSAQFMVLITFSTIMEFVIVVTGHRAISAAIGGETEIFGLSKIV